MAKPAVKLCAAGHRQTGRWKAGGYCLDCDMNMRREEREAEERAAMADIEPLPDAFEIRSGDGKSVQRFSIPRGLRRRARRR